MSRKRQQLPLPIRAKRMLARIKHVRGLSEDEKALHALGLAATPEERWELVQNHVHFLKALAATKSISASTGTNKGLNLKTCKKKSPKS